MKSVILDVDTGIDDALAIAYAIHSPELNILGITTGFGNVSAEEATRNTLQVLQLLNRADIPVYRGAERPFRRESTRHRAYDVHGQDGLGNIQLPPPELLSSGLHASDFIISMVKKYPHEITLITVGTQTNLALALEKEPFIIDLVKEVIIMGGAVTVPGNVTPAAEANFYADAEGADFVLQSGLPITLVGLDVTMKTLLQRRTLADWGSCGLKTGEIFAEMCSFYMDFYESKNPGLGGCALHDPLAVGVAVDPSFIKTTSMGVRISKEPENLGQSIGVAADKGISVGLEVDAERFRAHFLNRILPAEKKGSHHA
ncbi:nucleoside hydrolase [Fictibacillus terranigra]|uniref:Nucleoside hydrolase n=1 Tax=Fictibacillus terranigra TaxID=3058424 RepID=A0ABT8E7V2_9BACL|nr:nucleoside hydrolase [Fictibacillus sp. CENA-BCM004]MDN4073992.1 nucleoside hydrolase [Fictibacillus sp. CENA-BCM004]